MAGATSRQRLRTMATKVSFCTADRRHPEIHNDPPTVPRGIGAAIDIGVSSRNGKNRTLRLGVQRVRDVSGMTLDFALNVPINAKYHSIRTFFCGVPDVGLGYRSDGRITH